MSISWHSSLDLLIRISRRWLAFLGTTVGGIAAQLLIFVLTAIKGRWFRRATWTGWKQTRRKQLMRALRAMIVVWALAFGISSVMTILNDQSALRARCQRLESENKSLRGKFDALQTRSDITNHRTRRTQFAKSESEKARVIVSEAHRLSADILSYLSEIDMNRPLQILSVSSPALTDRTIFAGVQYEKNVLLDFFPRFSARIYQVEGGFRERGIDTFSLDTHLAHLINTQMFRLVAADLNGMAEQLDRRVSR